MKVKIFTTGGTIDKIYFDAKSQYAVGQSALNEILLEANLAVDYEIESLMRKDSLDITEEDRNLICQAVQSAAEEHILVTHGTDTMVETALALREIGNKTIVLTGSMAPARFRSSDAVFNVGFAMAAVQTLPNGVYIAMNGRVFKTGRVRKNRAENRFEFVER